MTLLGNQQIPSSRYFLANEVFAHWKLRKMYFHSLPTIDCELPAWQLKITEGSCFSIFGANASFSRSPRPLQFQTCRRYLHQSKQGALNFWPIALVSAGFPLWRFRRGFCCNVGWNRHGAGNRHCHCCKEALFTPYTYLQLLRLAVYIFCQMHYLLILSYFNTEISFSGDGPKK